MFEPSMKMANLLKLPLKIEVDDKSIIELERKRIIVNKTIYLPKEPNASLFFATALLSGELAGKARGEQEGGLLGLPDEDKYAEVLRIGPIGVLLENRKFLLWRKSDGVEVVAPLSDRRLAAELFADDVGEANDV